MIAVKEFCRRPGTEEYKRGIRETHMGVYSRTRTDIPLNDDDGRMIYEGKEVDPKSIDDVGRIIGEFLAPNEPIDYENLNAD